MNRAMLTLSFFMIFGSVSFFSELTLASSNCSFTDMQNPKYDPITGQQICGSSSAAQPIDIYSSGNASSNTRAKAPSNQPRQVAAVNKYSGMDCNVGLRVPLGNLDYVNINFASRLSAAGGKCTVVSGDNDAQARRNCNGYIINPGNPQYLKDGGYGDLSSNTLGYYFCITGADFNKKRMCDEMAADQKRQNTGLSVVFQQIGADGNCMCGASNSLHKVDCAQADLKALASNDVGCDESVGFTSNPNPDKSQARCICNTSKGYKNDGKGSCTAPVAAAVSGDISPALVACVQAAETEAKTCESSAQAAKKTCDQKNPENKEVTEAMGATEKVGDLFINNKTGTGSVNECIQAGAMAKSPGLLMNALKESCDANYTECNKSCGEEKVEEYTKKCGGIAKQLAQTTGTEDNNKNMKYFQDHLAVIQTAQETGTKICKEDATKNYSIFGDVLKGIGESIAGAARCACQYASSGMGTSASTCNSLPTSEQCTANPSLAGCPAVLAIDICSPGSSNYSYVGCKCQQNPKDQGCPQYVAANPNLNGFAGMDISGSGTTSGGASFGAPASPGGISSSDLNLNGNTASEVASGNKSSGLGSGFANGGAGGGGGGGGLGSASGGGPEAPHAGGDGDGEKGALGGAFGFAKSIAGSLFGGGSNAKKNDAASKTNPNYNMNKYQPRSFGGRGVANDELGGMNGEIWNMMHDRFEFNQTTFITNP